MKFSSKLFAPSFAISYIAMSGTIHQSVGFTIKNSRSQSIFLLSNRAERSRLFTSFHTKRESNKQLCMSADDETDYGDEIDTTSLGDWRTFRMNLAETGLPMESSSTTSVESSPVVNKQETQKIKSVSKENENLLKHQNKKLAEEYLSGVWAHSTPTPEVGSLVCRLPLEAEIHRLQDRNIIGKKLQDRLKLDVDFDDVSSTTDANAPYPYPSLDGTNGSASNSHSLSFSPLAAQTLHWYRGAQRLVKNELKRVTDHADNGRIDSRKLSDESIEFLNLYLDNQESWQDVNLLVSRDKQTSTITSLKINRPMTTKLTESLGQLLLFGSAVTGGSLTLPQTELLVRFLIAFESKCYVYIGGSECQGDPAEIIHGISHLEGSREIAPGIGIYKGGTEAAVQGVMKGIYKPEEFRFFVGKEIYEDSELERKVLLGKYQPVACARSLALKQCISLPKPLWNEVLELCGGELKEISSLELMKRGDIMPSRGSNENNGANKRNGKDEEGFDWGNEDSV